MRNPTFAPVCVPTLFRYEHFKRCIDSLSQCTHADNTDLFIALDFPSKDSHNFGYQKILDYIPTIKGFKNILVIKRELNFGAFKNSFDSMSSIFEKYDRVIFTEDDNVFSPNFLDYINKGLEKYKSNNDVYAICGYNYPYSLKKYNKNVYCANEISAWGIGYWRDKYISVTKEVYNFSYIESILSTRKLSSELHNKNFSIYNDLLTQKTKKTILEDCLISAYLLFNDKYCIFPAISKVRNWGQDGSGVNSGNMRKKGILYTEQIIDSEYNFFYDDISIEKNAEVQKMTKNIIKRSYLKRIVIFIRYLIYVFLKKDILKHYYK